MFGLVPWWVNLGVGAAAVLGLLFLGDAYGFHAHRLAKLEAQNQARNDAVDYQAEHDEAALAAKDIADRAADRQFDAARRHVNQCVTDAAQTAVINLVRE